MNRLLTVSIFSLSLLLAACKPDKKSPEPTDQVPGTYNFDGVEISGQIVRQLLLLDLEAKMESAKTTAVSSQELRALFDSTNTALNLYTDLSSGKRLSDSFLRFTSASVGQDNPNSTFRLAFIDSVRTWLDTIALRSQNESTRSKAYIRHDGVDLKQAVAKSIMGGVFYDQAVNKYLAKVPNDNNSEIVAGKNYTVMQHSYDEAFGYFGAMRNYNNYSDTEKRNPGEFDANGDGKIDPLSERNYFFSKTAASRDLNVNYSTGARDYTKEIFDAFILGRYSLDKYDYSTRDFAIIQVKSKWDEIIAATVVHYIIETEKGGADLSKHWTEMKYYFFIHSVAPNKLSATQKAQLDQLFGKKPSDATAENLALAKEIIKSVYGF
ncbi:MAG: DUF4856 domain-containing protein [Cytophagaceae bacterium]